MRDTIQKLSAELNKRKGRRDAITERVAAIEAQLSTLFAKVADTDAARVILQTVAQETQVTFVSRITDIVSSALDAVFGSDAYSFVIDFVQRRNKTEADIYFERDGNRISPMDSSGGGPVDVASFALRVALWSLLRTARGDSLSDTIVLDEPFRFLSRDLQLRAGEMLSTLSHKLGIQFLFVTHVQDLIDSADKVFTVKKNNGISEVKS